MTESREIKHLTKILLNSHRPVFMQSEFNALIVKNKQRTSTIKNITKKLTDAGVIQTVILRSDGYKDVKRISIPGLNPTPYHYAVSLRKGAYLSHASSINILGLTQQIPKVIYVNKEQSPKKQSSGSLTQEAIDRAFSNQQRRSKYIFRIGDYRIVLLSGKYSRNAGVEVDNVLNLPRTCLERTLIDITVRPRYAGGVFKVLETFKNAITYIDFEKLINYLDIMDYKYPYHQSLGFYLERAGASASDLQLFSSRGINFNFYLDYSMASTGFDESWRIFYPLGI